MKILHIIPSLEGGGAEKFCIDLCNELSLKHDVTICSLFNITEDMFMAKALNPNIRLITLNKKPGLDLSVFIKIYTLVKQNNYDVINTHLRAIRYSFLASLLNSTKFFHTVHSLAVHETNKANRRIYKIMFKYLHVLPIGISKKVSQSIQMEYGSQFDTIILNGVKRPDETSEFDNVTQEITTYKKTSSTRVFLTIGRIATEKNHRMLVEVFNRLINEGEDIILLIIGDDLLPNKPLRQMLLQLAKSNIHFLGLKDNISDYLLCSDAFCLSSLYEGLPITLLESMSLGTIPVCTPVGGIVDVIHDGINGLLSKDTSPDEFYQTIKRFLSFKTNEKESISNKASEDFMEFYNITITANAYINLYAKEINYV